jgi:hypothetical protein
MPRAFLPMIGGLSARRFAGRDLHLLRELSGKDRGKLPGGACGESPAKTARSCLNLRDCPNLLLITAKRNGRCQDSLWLGNPS